MNIFYKMPPWFRFVIMLGGKNWNARVFQTLHSVVIDKEL